MSGADEEEVYISVDVEAAGPIPGTYSMLSLGACVVGTPEDSFYVELVPINDRAVPEALSISGFSLDDLRERGEEPAEAMRRFRSWVNEVAGGRSPVFVGYNAGFDWSFVNWYLHTFGGGNPFGFAPLDIKAYYMGMRGCLWRETTSRQLPAEFKPSSISQQHNAAADARAQAEIFEKIFRATRRRQPDE